jgi:DNA-binding MarR family transcriptional regulator
MAEVREAFRLHGQAGDTMDLAASGFLSVHRTDTRLLDVLQMSGGMSAGELARAGHLSPAAVTAALDRLEKAGYVRRFRDQADRRRVLVEVTARMQKLSRELYGPLSASLAEMMSGFSEPQLLAVRDLLREATRLQLEQAERVRNKRRPEGG